MVFNKTKSVCVWNNQHDFAIAVDFGYGNDIGVKTEFELINGELLIKSQSIIGHSRDFNAETRNTIINDIENIINQKY